MVIQVFNNAREMVGDTSLVRLDSLSGNKTVEVYAKLEYENPTGSHKDRLVNYMLQKAQEAGELDHADTVVEASSGNTATSLAFMAKQYGLKSMVFVPSSISNEKIFEIESFGATAIRVSQDSPFQGWTDYMQAAKEFSKTDSHVYLLNQYDSLRNREAHYNGLGKEISAHFNKGVDVFVSVASTGGTVSGVGRYLKEQNPDAKVVLADPVGSVYYPSYYQINDAKLKKSAIAGAGKAFVTANMDFSVIDRVERFTDRQAYDMVLRLAKETGLFVGGTAAANALVAERIAKEAPDHTTIVTIFPDSGLKYKSKFSDPEWCNSLTDSYSL